MERRNIRREVLLVSFGIASSSPGELCDLGLMRATEACLLFDV